MKSRSVRRKKIFERNPQFTGNYDLALLLKLNEKEEDRQFIRFTAKGTPDNQLFLRELIVRKVAENVSYLSDITSVYNWFLNTLKIVFPEDKYNVGLESEVNDNERLNTIYKELLKYFGTGIVGGMPGRCRAEQCRYTGFYPFRDKRALDEFQE